MKNVSAVFVASTAVCWGISGGIGAMLMNNGWDAYVVSWYRGAVGLLFVLLWLLLRPKRNGLANARLWFWSVIAGIGVAGNFSFYFLSINEGSVAVAATLMYSAPIFVYLVSFALKLEVPTSLKWGAIVLAMLGIVLLTQVYDIATSGLTFMGIGAGLLAGVSYAVFIFGFKFAAPHGSPQAILSIAFAVLVALLLIPSSTHQVAAAWASDDWPLFVLLGVLGAGLSFVLYIIGLNYTLPAIASVIAMVEPVTASLFGVWILGEVLNGVQLIGMVVILFTVTALSVRSDTHLTRRGLPYRS
ncbi:EamA family transporter [Aliidiomarina halalkaliphila]|uniref:EamA family transporter n=1 Tax=Aliidiomarina halalkaliphila TaxID=2593535 RepID=A0A552X384_9GAMM|nr:EamA family transporter [Aliidiomarina halalkaliphila]TRW49445.1 EamA family transporter [Aliidiomarina halalkaliphila]